MSEWDRKNIAFLISFYEKAFPGVIKQVAQEARRDIIAERKLRYGKPKSAIDWHRRMAIPEGLMNELRRSYPALIVDKGQFEQFLKWFSQFDLRNV
jgi:hypothetical protein